MDKRVLKSKMIGSSYYRTLVELGEHRITASVKNVYIEKGDIYHYIYETSYSDGGFLEAESQLFGYNNMEIKYINNSNSLVYYNFTKVKQLTDITVPKFVPIKIAKNELLIVEMSGSTNTRATAFNIFKWENFELVKIKTFDLKLELDISMFANQRISEMYLYAYESYVHFTLHYYTADKKYNSLNFKINKEHDLQQVDTVPYLNQNPVRVFEDDNTIIEMMNRDRSSNALSYILLTDKKTGIREEVYKSSDYSLKMMEAVYNSKLKMITCYENDNTNVSISYMLDKSNIKHIPLKCMDNSVKSPKFDGKALLYRQGSIKQDDYFTSFITGSNYIDETNIELQEEGFSFESSNFCTVNANGSITQSTSASILACDLREINKPAMKSTEEYVNITEVIDGIEFDGFGIETTLSSSNSIKKLETKEYIAEYTGKFKYIQKGGNAAPNQNYVSGYSTLYVYKNGTQVNSHKYQGGYSKFELDVVAGDSIYFKITNSAYSSSYSSYSNKMYVFITEASKVRMYANRPSLYGVKIKIDDSIKNPYIRTAQRGNACRGMLLNGLIVPSYQDYMKILPEDFIELTIDSTITNINQIKDFVEIGNDKGTVETIDVNLTIDTNRSTVAGVATVTNVTRNVNRSHHAMYEAFREVIASVKIMADTKRNVETIIRVSLNCSTKRNILANIAINSDLRRSVGLLESILIESRRIIRRSAHTKTVTVRRVNRTTQLSIDTKRRTLSEFSLVADTNRKSSINIFQKFDTGRYLSIDATISSVEGQITRRVFSFGFEYKLYNVVTSFVNKNSRCTVKKYDAKTGDYIETVEYSTVLNGESGKYAYKVEIISQPDTSFIFTVKAIYADIKIEAIPFSVTASSTGYVKVNNSKNRVIKIASDSYNTVAQIKLYANSEDESYPFVLKYNNNMLFRHSKITAAEGKHYAFIAYVDCDYSARLVKMASDTARHVTYLSKTTVLFDTKRVKGIPTSIKASTLRIKTVTQETAGEVLRLIKANVLLKSDLRRSISTQINPAFNTARSLAINTDANFKTLRVTTVNNNKTYDANRNIIINANMDFNTKRKCIAVTVVTSDTKVIKTNNAKVIADTERESLITSNVISDLERITIGSYNINFDSDRLITHKENILVNLKANTFRNIIKNIGTNTDTIRGTTVGTLVTTDTKRGTLVSVKILAKTSRKVNTKMTIKTDTARLKLMRVNTLSDTTRAYGIGANASFSSIRTVYISENRTIDTKRELNVLNSSKFDTTRSLSIAIATSFDTLRLMLTGASVDIKLDTKRIAAREDKIKADVKRMTIIASSSIYNTSRVITSTQECSGDTSRLIQNIIATRHNTSRTPLCASEDIKHVLEIELTEINGILRETNKVVKNSLIFRLEVCSEPFTDV